jgi:hypothetical protein
LEGNTYHSTHIAEVGWASTSTTTTTTMNTLSSFSKHGHLPKDFFQNTYDNNHSETTADQIDNGTTSLYPVVLDKTMLGWLL